LPILMMQSNPARGWMMVPGETHYTYHHPVHVNALGLRGREVGPKQPGTLRLLALGDSLVYGQGVADDETLPAYLEAQLNLLPGAAGEGRRWEVINAGHRAYDTRQELALVDELEAQLDPDVVVLFWYWNDLLGRDIRDTYERLKLVEPVTFDTGDRLEGWSGVRWRLRQVARRSALLMFVHDLIGWRKAKPVGPELRANGLARVDRHLERFVAQSRELGFLPVFAVVPDSRALRGSHQSEEIGAEIEELARRHGLATISLLAPLRELGARTDGSLTIPFDGHYLPQANLAMAQHVAARLVALRPPD
jgi:hypothetical protein